MKDPQLFKERVAELCELVDWNPTLLQLAEIARRFGAKPPESAADVLVIVQAVCPPRTYRAWEGVDNSDLRVLLALAIAAARS